MSVTEICKLLKETRPLLGEPLYLKIMNELKEKLDWAELKKHCIDQEARMRALKNGGGNIVAHVYKDVQNKMYQIEKRKP